MTALLGHQWYDASGMDERSAKRRGEMLERLSDARTGSDVSEAEREADAYLKRHPHDVDVVVAAEKLDERAAKVRDPERKANRWSIAVFVGMSALITLVLLGYAEARVLAVLAGVLIAGEVANGVWDTLRTRAEHEESR